MNFCRYKSLRRIRKSWLCFVKVHSTECSDMHNLSFFPFRLCRACRMFCRMSMSPCLRKFRFRRRKQTVRTRRIKSKLRQSEKPCASSLHLPLRFSIFYHIFHAPSIIFAKRKIFLKIAKTYWNYNNNVL